MTSLLDRLRARGLRLTAQRRVVAEVLAGEHLHLTADEVLARATASLPEISRATVYNTLRELVGLGEVAELSGEGRAKLYDPNAHAPHHHLVCERCGAIRDVSPSGADAVALPAAQRHGFSVSGVAIVFRGLCPACRAQESHPGSARRAASQSRTARDPRRLA